MPETAPSPRKRPTATGNGAAVAVQAARLPVLAGSAPGDPIARALAAWMRSYEASPHTARAYAAEARRFAAFLARTPSLGGILACKASAVSAYIGEDVAESGATRARRVAVLRSLFAALVRDELRADNPAADIVVRHAKSGRHHTAVPQGLVIETLRRLAGSERPQDIRDRALLLVMLNTAARRSEVASLNVSSLDRGADGKNHLVFTGKGRKAARMLLHASCVQAVDRWLALAGHGDDPAAPLFHCLSHRPDHRGRRLTGVGVGCVIKALFSGFSAHSVRARSGTDAWQESGKNLHVAQNFLRHANPAVTAEVYIQPESEAWAQGFAVDYGAMV
jgi:integrase/recombinase XerD